MLIKRSSAAVARKFFLLILPLLMLSCGGVTESDLAKLNGYWEIETAVMPDGSEKEYAINTTIDYFELKGKEGMRKKVMPQIDGTYRTGDNFEQISISIENGKTYINYTTDFAKWKEEIITLEDDELVLKNAHDMEYHYKKPVPFSVK